MKILYLSCDPGVPVLGPKGASVHLRSLASAFAALGHEVVIASPRIERAENELDGAIRLVEIPPVLPRECGTVAELRVQMEAQAEAVAELVRDCGSEVVYERYSLASVAGARAARERDRPLLLEVNAPLRDEAARFRVLVHEDAARAAEQEVFTAAARIFAVSRPLAEWLVAEGADPGRVQVMPNAFPAHRFPAKRPLGEDELVAVGFAGSLKPWHGIDTLLQAFALAFERGARMRLEVAGTGPAEARLRETSLPPERFAVLGRLPHRDLLARLEHWDVGLATYTALEDFYFSPLKLLEYMAAGLCPVASAVGEIPELLDNGDAGVLVPADDAQRLADALVALDADRGRLRELGRRAQEKAAEGPTWLDNAGRVLAGLETREAA